MDNREMLKHADPADFKPPFNKIAAAIGKENTLKLCEIKGGGRLSVPKADALMAAVRKRLIRQDYAKGGVTADMLALRYDVCVKTVWNYLRHTEQA